MVEKSQLVVVYKACVFNTSVRSLVQTVSLECTHYHTFIYNSQTNYCIIKHITSNSVNINIILVTVESQQVIIKNKSKIKNNDNSKSCEILM